MCQIDLVAGDKQFPAAPGVLDVDTFCPPVQIDHCNKTVRTFQKCAGGYALVLHDASSFSGRKTCTEIVYSLPVQLISAVP